MSVWKNKSRGSLNKVQERMGEEEMDMACVFTVLMGFDAQKF